MVELLSETKVVHTFLGSDSNEFKNQILDLTPWSGKELRLRLTDKAEGAWGSIGIDQVILTDTSGAPVKTDSLRDWGSMALGILSDKAQAQACAYSYFLPKATE